MGVVSPWDAGGLGESVGGVAPWAHMLTGSRPHLPPEVLPPITGFGSLLDPFQSFCRRGRGSEV